MTKSKADLAAQEYALKEYPPPVFSDQDREEVSRDFLAGIAWTLIQAEQIERDMEDGPHNSYWAGMKEGMRSMFRELWGLRYEQR